MLDKTDEVNDTDAPGWGVWQSFGIGLTAFFAPQIIIGLFIGFISRLNGQTIDDLISGDNLFMLFGLSLALSLFGSAIIIKYVKSKSSISKLGFNKVSFEDLALALPAYAVYFLAIIAVNILLSTLLPNLNLDQAQETGFNQAGGTGLIFAFVTLVLIAPIYEELLFRGFVFRGVAAKYGLWPAAIVVSALFGLAHGQLNVAIDTFVLGLAASWLVYNTKSIWPAIMLHMIKNLVAYIFLFVIDIEV